MNDTSQPDSHPLPLSGIRVLDLTRVLAGPYCTMILADLGAEVVKIERPGIGDDSRHFGPFLPSGLSAYFASINRGKKSVALDLKEEDARATFRELVVEADIVVENFRPGTMEAWGLSAGSLKEINPRLIQASLSGYGHSGGVNLPAYDVIIQAMSGLMSITGEGEGHSVRVGTSISDILTGMFGAIAVVSALRHRDRVGEGCVADLSMLDCAVAALENAVARHAVTGEIPVPLGTRHPSITPFQAFGTADRPIVVAAGNDALWRKLCQVLDLKELADDPRLADNASRTGNSRYLEDQLTPAFRRQSQQHWLQQLAKAGVPSAPIRNVAEVMADPLLHERHMLHEMQGAAGEDFLTAGSPLRMNGQPPPLSPRAPELGEHTNSVLDEWLNRS